MVDMFGNLEKVIFKIIGGFDESYPRLQDVALHSNALKFHNVNYWFSQS